VKIEENQELIADEKVKRFEHFKVLSTTWGTVVLTVVIFITPIFCTCSSSKFCRQFAFWMWDKWTPRDCVRHSRERCFIITNINAERVQYSEIPRTPPHTLKILKYFPQPRELLY